MNQETLRALVLDRELGELTPEASLLLDAYLSEHPEWESEKRVTSDLLRLATETTQCYPERGHPGSSPSSPWRGEPARLAAMAAIIAVFAGLSLFTAYRIGQKHSAAAVSPGASPPLPQIASNPSPVAMPWARYELQPTHRGYTVVPLANPNHPANQ